MITKLNENELSRDGVPVLVDSISGRTINETATIFNVDLLATKVVVYEINVNANSILDIDFTQSGQTISYVIFDSDTLLNVVHEDVDKTSMSVYLKTGSYYIAFDSKNNTNQNVNFYATLTAKSITDLDAALIDIKNYIDAKLINVDQSETVSLYFATQLKQRVDEIFV